ncbi:hypothetical protein BV22DRAFT_1121035 [Leucogyrophana mollusca]|uniref:Uncharacterized protein n=1 Tax=Leucogyrophana mollusca TaxID=85980 RepID=A0ACB8BBS8_9AGAM|nr:hypothetical protein BV22DRAFT_1121035 [Leucogyrophana mollusca]
MVNVNAQYPFNLHNQVLGEPSPSRSVSGGTLADSGRGSPSPRRSLQKSYSYTSLNDPEGPSSQQNYGNDDGTGDRMKPILNVRLVKAAGRYGATRNGQGSARGRPVRSREQSMRIVVADSEDEAGCEVGEGSEDEGMMARTPRPPTHLSGQRDPPPNVTSELSTDGNLSAPQPAEDFTIRDAGAISRSWGD